MTSYIRIMLSPVLVATTAVCASAQDKNAEQEEAIAAINKMNGSVDIDQKRPGKPVIRVHLFEGKTVGIGLAPLAKLPEIEWIGLHASDITEADLEHLKGLTKLRRLGLVDTRLNDAGLKRLEGMTSLEMLYLNENPITDAGLENLRKLTKLRELGLGQTKTTDAGLERLKPFKDLQALQLQRLGITSAGLKHLKTMPKLEKLDLTGCNQLKDLAPLEGLPLTWLNLFDCRQVHDLTPLAGMDLSEIYLAPKNFTKDGLEVLRRCKTLKAIVIGYKNTDRHAPEEFWKKLDAGEFKP
jgi:hypothetical protein